MQRNKPINQKKTEPTTKTGFTVKPTQKLSSVKTGDPFAPSQRKQDGGFQYVYNLGGIPCKIDHGSIKNKIKWNQNVDIDNMSLDPLLITCFEGLIETKHPYNFIAKQACIDLLQTQNLQDRILPILQRLVWPLRNALKSTNTECQINALLVFKMLVEVVQTNLNIHLKNLLVPLSKLIANKNTREQTVDTLNSIDSLGGQEATKQIKSQVPQFYK